MSQQAFFSDWQVDSGDVQVNKLVCLNHSRAIICPPSSKLVLGVAANAGSTGEVITLCTIGHCAVTPDNDVTAGDWLVPSENVAGEAHDVGYDPIPGVQNFIAETSGKAGQPVIANFAYLEEPKTVAQNPCQDQQKQINVLVILTLVVLAFAVFLCLRRGRP